jgi:hypothetical protein
MLDRLVIGGRSRKSLDERRSCRSGNEADAEEENTEELTKTSLTKLIGQTVPSTNTLMLALPRD